MTTKMLEDASARVSRDLSILFLLNLSFGVSVGTGLFLIGVPSPVLWGILAGILRFIPYIGPWIAASMPIGLSMAISPGWGLAIVTVLLFVVLELFNNNLFESWLYGKKTGVSPGDVNKAQNRIGCGAILVSTVAEALKEILLMSGIPAPQSDPFPPSESEPKMTAGA